MGKASNRTSVVGGVLNPPTGFSLGCEGLHRPSRGGHVPPPLFVFQSPARPPRAGQALPCGIFQAPKSHGGRGSSGRFLSRTSARFFRPTLVDRAVPSCDSRPRTKWPGFPHVFIAIVAQPHILFDPFIPKSMSIFLKQRGWSCVCWNEEV